MTIKKNILLITLCCLVAFMFIVGNSQAATDFSQAKIIDTEFFPKKTLKGGQSMLFNIKAQQGWAILASGKLRGVAENVDNRARITLYNGKKHELKRQTFFINYNSIRDFNFSYLLNSNQKEYNLYIKIECLPPNSEISFKSFVVQKQKRFDSLNTDAGNTFKDSINIKPSAYGGYISGDIGQDNKDVYNVDTGKNKEVTAELVYNPSYSPNLMMYNKKGEPVDIIKQRRIKGRLRKTMISSDDKYYVVIECANKEKCQDIFSYDLILKEKEIKSVEQNKGEVGKNQISGIFYVGITILTLLLLVGSVIIYIIYPKKRRERKD